MKERFQYGFADYDDFFCLRTPWLLVASMFFLCRDWLVLVVIAGIGMGGASVRIADFISTDHLWLHLLAAVPAALVLYAQLSKVPTAHAIVRWFWRNGRILLTVSALSQIAIVAAPYWPDVRGWVDGPLVEKAIILVALWVVGYVLLSARVKHTFVDFPSK